MIKQANLATAWIVLDHEGSFLVLAFALLHQGQLQVRVSEHGRALDLQGSRVFGVDGLVIVGVEDEIPFVPCQVVGRSPVYHQAAVCDAQSDEVLPAYLSLDHRLHTGDLREAHLGERARLSLKLKLEEL